MDTVEKLEIATANPAVRLRELSLSDAQVLFALIDCNREHLSQLDDDTAQKYPNLATLEYSIEHPKRGRIQFGIWWEDTLVGSANLQFGTPISVEIGYWIGKQFTRRGFATIAARALVAYADQLQNVVYVGALAHKENMASQRVLENVGLKATGHTDEHMHFCLTF